MRILIIHTAFIGDIVLSTPLIRKLKEKYKDAHISYVTTPLGAKILENNPNLSEIIVYDKNGAHKGLGGVWELGRRLRYGNYNMVITPHRYLRSTILSWLTRSPIRKCYDITTLRGLFTEKIHYDKSRHEVEKLLSFVDDDTKRYEIELYPSEDDKKKIDKLWTNNNLEDKKVVVLAPGSKWFTKQWPLEYFNILIDGSKQYRDIKVIIVGGKEEKSLKLETKGIIDMRGETSLLELAELISRSRLIVTNDSSPIHIASAFENVRILAIFGPTVKELGFFPWSKNSKVLENTELKCRPCGLHGGNSCPEKHFKCMREIYPGTILKEITNYLGCD